jgi:2-hydroxychromene-2-carboxylate isomerase
MIAAAMSQPTFYYDFNSPYAYLAAHRVDEVLPVRAHWQPIAFGALIRHTVLACARDAGIDPDAVARGVEEPEVKQRLRDATDAAIASGVTGVPTVAVGDELFWGDDRLEDAATALARG